PAVPVWGASEVARPDPSAPRWSAASWLADRGSNRLAWRPPAWSASAPGQLAAGPGKEEPSASGPASPAAGSAGPPPPGPPPRPGAGGPGPAGPSPGLPGCCARPGWPRQRPEQTAAWLCGSVPSGSRDADVRAALTGFAG